MIRRGQVADGKTLLGFLMAHRRQKKM